ncbi:MAG: acetylornithine transaminase [Gemmatimonadetes bacterium]|nr:acetylornithine transaminase [Gemmatimonadota bacterium]
MNELNDPRPALLGVYAPPDMLFERACGSWLIDREGRRYLDFTSGIAVTALGHGAPEVRAAIEAALDSGLIHASNLFRTEPAEALATELVQASFPGSVFFCNSGAEAGEAALKFARRWARSVGGADKHEVVAFRRGFHGRLFGTLATTDREAYRAPFEPLMPGVRWAEVGDLASVEAVVDPARTAAVVIEPVQGEGGVRPVPADFLIELRRLCNEHGVALIFDEVQCGLGRTGDLFAFEASGVRPDLLSLAKPLAGGLPMGAVVVAPAIAETIQPGDHGTTFGGGPMVAGVARAVLATVSAPAFLRGVRERAARVETALHGLREADAGIVEVRGRGLMWGIELDRPAAPVVAAARERGLLVCSAGASVVRLLPALNIPMEELDQGLAILGGILTGAVE